MVYARASRTGTRWTRWPSPTQNGVTDEFVEPVVCDSEGVISDNDSIIFFNFRPDRAREITRVFVDRNLTASSGSSSP